MLLLSWKMEPRIRHVQPGFSYNPVNSRMRRIQTVSCELICLLFQENTCHVPCYQRNLVKMGLMVASLCFPPDTDFPVVLQPTNANEKTQLIREGARSYCTDSWWWAHGGFTAPLLSSAMSLGGHRGGGNMKCCEHIHICILFLG